MFKKKIPSWKKQTVSTDAVLKKANVMPGAMVVERTYGMLEVHADSPADVIEAGEVVLDYLGMQEKDRLKPKILAAETIERTDPYMSQIVNRFRAASMMIVDDTLYILECLPAGYAGYAANEAEKAADVKLIHVTVFGASFQWTGGVNQFWDNAENWSLVSGSDGDNIPDADDDVEARHASSTTPSGNAAAAAAGCGCGAGAISD